VSVTPEELVVLVDAAGQPIGQVLKNDIHGTQTPLHLAFSVHIFDDFGRVLLTRRGLSKRTWPGVWTNTCCGHPAPSEAIEQAVRRRLRFELGLEVDDLKCVLPDFTYTATDASGIVENEICPVFEARLPHPAPRLSANPEEVMDLKWVKWDDLARAVRLTPFAFSPWAVSQIGQLDQRRTQQQ
jgi:isopentenyl-diphosphate delta-isomerase type 1